jgi:hypothetical protein
MRILGAFLFVTGFLLLFTVILAGLGIFLMFLGLILMVVGGRRKVVINNIVSVNAPSPVLPREMQRDFVEAQPRAQQREPVLEPRDRFVLPPPDRGYNRGPELRTINPEPYDKAKWRALVEYDPDISRVVSALSPYGQKYIDQLATGYLALNDKDYLPMIVQKILATAKEDAARRN